ncbi:hypothetical protein ACE3MS_15490 [Paenibacillus dendritiformis]|uniref:hypothetical protein n=1 Tax=Paenibacillus dendritiformis TaxID=130049 RepID=UPI0036666DF9
MSEILIIIGASIIVAIIWAIFKARSDKKKMDKKASEAGAISAFTADHVEGIGLTSMAECDIYLFADKVLIDSFGRKFEIPLSRIRAAEFKSEQEIKEKSKTVAGRALIGTLLVPGLGTIVGGMSGIGNKKVKGETNFYLIINFIDSNGELNGVTFRNNFNTLRGVTFSSKINQQLSATQQDIVTL